MKQNRLLTTCILLAVLLVMQNGYSQCGKIKITGPDDPIILSYDGNERLVSITGIDKEEGAKSINLSVVNGLSLPVKGQKGVTWAPNDANTVLVTMNDADGDDGGEAKSQFKISMEGKLLTWGISHEGALKTTTYTYDKNGDVAKMVWDGASDSKVTDHGVLTATFNTAKPAVIMKGGPMLFLVEAAWQMFPMTNSHQITSLSYTQTIHMPERKVEVGKDKSGQVIYKITPAKDITKTYTKQFTYTYDAKGMPASITVTGMGPTQTFKFSYQDCK